MSLAIQLLGEPVVVSDGHRRRPRGRKVWGLLTHLILAEVGVSRQRLASLFFSEADDPLGALRWNLSELRRLLGEDATLGGPSLRLSLPPGAFVDVRVLTSGTWVEVLALPGLGRDLLEGLTFANSPAFEAWLMAERARINGLSGAILREVVQARLAADDPTAAIRPAASLVSLDPFDEEAQVLLVKAYASAGDRKSAERSLAACVELFQLELSVDPTPKLRAALEVEGRSARSASGRAAVQARLEAGEAAITAGSLESGFTLLRQAAQEAGSLGDSELEGRGLFSLGSSLIHAVRGRDDEGAQFLHRALALAQVSGNNSLALAARRDLGYVEALAGRYTQAQRWLEEALDLAAADPAERAWLGATLGMVRSDCGHYAEAIQRLEAAADLAQEAGARKTLAWALSFLGRARFLMGDPGGARVPLEAARDLSRDSWPYFLPWSEALLAEVEIADGETHRAHATFEHAFALGCQIGDPCWEAMAQRGLGLCAIRFGNIQEGIALLNDAYLRARRFPDAYHWVAGYCLEALAAAAIANGSPLARAWVTDLASFAARTGMRELLVIAQLHRASLGEAGAIEAASTLAAEVDSEHLRTRVSSHVGSHP